MTFSPRLTRQLDVLSAALDDGVDLGAILAVLTDDLHASIPSFLGLHLTLPGPDRPVTLSTLDPDDTPRVRASLLLPLGMLTAIPPDARVVYYAAAPRAFHSLAADARDHYHLDGHAQLDEHLAPTPQPSNDLTDPDDAVVNQVVGALIATGHTPDQAHHLLDQETRRTGHTRATVAQHILLTTLTD